MHRPLPILQFSWLASLLMFGACANSKSPSPGGRYVVSVQKAAFYKYGPAQSFGPDLQLAQGQKLTMLDRGFGYSHVTTDDGTSGYVANEDVKPAPPEPAVARTGKPGSSSSGRGAGSKHSNVNSTPGSPLFDMNDVPMPLPDNYEPRPAPKFRY